MTYGRAFLVGLLNTLLVAGLGIVLRHDLGFTIGIARLSTNWLVARLPPSTSRSIRNVPLLLQLFFWYFAVLKTPAGAAAEPRAARRRLPQRARPLSAGARARAGLRRGRALGPGSASSRRSLVASGPAGARRATGQRSCRCCWTSLGADRAAAARRVHLRSAQPLGFDLSRAQGLQLRGRHGDAAGVHGAAARAVDLHGSFIAEIVRAGIQGVSQGPEGSGAAAIGLRTVAGRCGSSSSRRRCASSSRR